MSRVVTTVAPDTNLAEVADILDAHKIRRVPVTDKGKLVGIISRADIVRALAQAKVPIPVASMENGVLQKVIQDEIKKQPWIDEVYLNAIVNNGVVELMGFVDTAEKQTALRVLVEGVPGVKEVADHVRLRKWEVSA